jgi:hypothetical protein
MRLKKSEKWSAAAHCSSGYFCRADPQPGLFMDQWHLSLRRLIRRVRSAPHPATCGRCASTRWIAVAVVRT